MKRAVYVLLLALPGGLILIAVYHTFKSLFTNDENTLTEETLARIRAMPDEMEWIPEPMGEREERRPPIPEGLTSNYRTEVSR